MSDESNVLSQGFDTRESRLQSPDSSDASIVASSSTVIASCHFTHVLFILNAVYPMSINRYSIEKVLFRFPYFDGALAPKIHNPKMRPEKHTVALSFVTGAIAHCVLCLLHWLLVSENAMSYATPSCSLFLAST